MGTREEIQKDSERTEYLERENSQQKLVISLFLFLSSLFHEFILDILGLLFAKILISLVLSFSYDFSCPNWEIDAYLAVIINLITIFVILPILFRDLLKFPNRVDLSKFVFKFYFFERNSKVYFLKKARGSRKLNEREELIQFFELYEKKEICIELISGKQELDQKYFNLSQGSHLEDRIASERRLRIFSGYETREFRISECNEIEYRHLMDSTRFSAYTCFVVVFSSSRQTDLIESFHLL